VKRRLGGLVALSCVLACAESEPRPSTDAVSSSSSIREADSVWYHRVRLLDVTGDGRPDSLDLQARGRSSDSSVFTFRVIVDGKVAFTDSWSSAYELVDPPPEAATPAGRDSLLRASLDTTLSRIRLRPIDPSDWSGPWSAAGDDCLGDPRDCVALELRRRGALDTAAVLRIATDMRRPDAVQFTLGYGYETTLNLAWSPSAQEVFVVYSCC
jgi:hypothetical protein